MQPVQLQRVSNGEPVILGAELGRGGEGIVHSLATDPGLVAKIYRKQPSAEKVAKLAAMARHSTPGLLLAAAWPMDLLRDGTGATLGFLMPRISARYDLHELYSPKSRKRRFPQADFRFVLHAAANLARAFAQVHAAGHVIGDVNHGNALVGDDGTVVLIDCDSFQVGHDESIHTCDVGSPLFTPPELCGLPFRGLRREIDHDAFGLAVLLFHLLFLGRHPFAGRSASGDLPIERAIAESRFAYGAAASALGVSRPPRTLSLGAFGERIAASFERAFARPNGSLRPDAPEWLVALTELQRSLKPCALSTAHFHPPAPRCCWCEVEERGGVRVYGTESKDTTVGRVAKLWLLIEKVPQPAPAPPTPALPASYMPEQVIEDVKVRYLRRALGLVAAVGAGAAFAPMAYGLVVGGASLIAGSALLAKYRARTDRIRVAGDALQLALQGWSRESSEDPFAARLRELETVRDRLLTIGREREDREKDLPARQVAARRQLRLERTPIVSAALPELDEGMIATLRSYGVEDADDVLRMPDTVAMLLKEREARVLREWAEERESDLAAEETSGDPVADYVADQRVHMSDETLRREEARFLARLREAPTQLLALREQVLKRRAKAEQAWVEARNVYLRARAELLS